MANDITVDLPSIGGDENTWGGKINVALVAAAAQANSARATADAASTAAATATSTAAAATTAAAAAATKADTATTAANAASTAANTAAAAASTAQATAAGVQTSLNALAGEAIVVPAGVLSGFSGTLSTQSANGIKSTIVLDAAAAANSVHAVGIAIPTDWQTFRIEAHGRPFGSSATATAMRLTATCVQYADTDDLWSAPAQSLVTVDMPIGTRAGVKWSSPTYTRDATKPVIAVYIGRDKTDALDTSTTRMIPTGFHVVKVS